MTIFISTGKNIKSCRGPHRPTATCFNILYNCTKFHCNRSNRFCSMGICFVALHFHTYRQTNRETTAFISIGNKYNGNSNDTTCK